MWENVLGCTARARLQGFLFVSVLLAISGLGATFSFTSLPLARSGPETARSLHFSSYLTPADSTRDFFPQRGPYAHWNSWRRHQPSVMKLMASASSGSGKSPAADQDAQSQVQGGKGSERDVISRRGLLGVGAATLLLANVKPAEAGFGSAGGAALSPPPVKRLSLDDLLQLGQDKRDQRTRSLFGNNLNNILNQLEQRETDQSEAMPEFDSLLDQLRQDAMYAKLEEKVKQRNAELATQRDIEKQLKARQKLLDRLDRQPQWVSYGAAFFASVSSTLVMHPVDTIKVRMMGKQAQKEVEEVDNFYAEPPEEEQPSELDDEDEPLVFQLTSNDTGGGPMSGAHGRGKGDGGGMLAVQVSVEAEVGAEGDGHSVDEVPIRLVSAAASEGTVTIERPRKTAGEQEESWVEQFGILSMYDGLLPNVFKEAPSSALYLGVYEAVRTALSQTPLAQQELLVYLLAGAVGELFGSVIRAPSEARLISNHPQVKTRVQTGDVGTMDAVNEVFGSAEGRRSTFTAWTSSLFRDVPAGAVQIALFEGLKVYILNSPNIDYDVTTLSAEALLGAIGGGVAAFLTTPTDVTTTSIITSSKQGKNVSILEVAKTVWETDGIKGFFTGSLQRTLYWAPAIGIFLSVYCSLRQFAITQGF